MPQARRQLRPSGVPVADHQRRILRSSPCVQRSPLQRDKHGKLDCGHRALRARPALEAVLQEKIELMGPFRVAVGGKTEGEEIGRGTKRKGPDTIEPVFWPSRPKNFFQEVIHRFKPKAIIDCGMSDGILALECTKMRIPYIGFGLTEIHVELLKAHMVQELMKSFHTEGEKEYDPELALLFKPEKGPVEAQPKKRLATSLVSGGASSSGGSVKAGADNSAGTSAGSLLANFKRKLEDLKNKTTTAADGEAEAPDSPE